MIRSIADYDFTIQHRLGREMVLPDAFSRLSGADKEKVQGTKVRVNELVDISYSHPQKLQEETNNDLELMKLKELVRTGWPRSSKSLEFRLLPY